MKAIVQIMVSTIDLAPSHTIGLILSQTHIFFTFKIRTKLGYLHIEWPQAEIESKVVDSKLWWPALSLWHQAQQNNAIVPGQRLL